MKLPITWVRSDDRWDDSISFKGAIHGCDTYVNVYQVNHSGWYWTVRSWRNSRNIISSTGEGYPSEYKAMQDGTKSMWWMPWR